MVLGLNIMIPFHAVLSVYMSAITCSAKLYEKVVFALFSHCEQTRFATSAL